MQQGRIRRSTNLAQTRQQRRANQRESVEAGQGLKTVMEEEESGSEEDEDEEATEAMQSVMEARGTRVRVAKEQEEVSACTLQMVSLLVSLHTSPAHNSNRLVCNPANVQQTRRFASGRDLVSSVSLSLRNLCGYSA
jgi:hypothetical protein